MANCFELEHTESLTYFKLSQGRQNYINIYNIQKIIGSTISTMRNIAAWIFEWSQWKGKLCWILEWSQCKVKLCALQQLFNESEPWNMNVYKLTHYIFGGDITIVKCGYYLLHLFGGSILQRMINQNKNRNMYWDMMITVQAFIKFPITK